MFNKKTLMKMVEQCIVKKPQYLVVGARTVAIIEIEDAYGDRHVAIGYATYNSKDKYDEERGKEIAKGKAIARLAKGDTDNGNPAVDFFKRWIKDKKKFEKTANKAINAAKESGTEVVEALKEMPENKKKIPFCPFAQTKQTALH